MARAVVTGDTGTVEHEGDAALVQRDVEQQLVERSVEEGRVEADDRVQTAHRQTGRTRHRVLLGDADVEDPVRELLRERRQAGRVQHRRGDRDHVRAAVADPDQLVGEHVGPAARLVDRPDLVEVVLLVLLGGGVPEPFWVTACTITGPPNAFALRSASSIA